MSLKTNRLRISLTRYFFLYTKCANCPLKDYWVTVKAKSRSKQKKGQEENITEWLWFYTISLKDCCKAIMQCSRNPQGEYISTLPCICAINFRRDTQLVWHFDFLFFFLFILTSKFAAIGAKSVRAHSNLERRKKKRNLQSWLFSWQCTDSL